MEILYLQTINSPAFIQGIVNRGEFSDWIRLAESVPILESLKEKLIEFEMYELIEEVNNLIKEYE